MKGNNNEERQHRLMRCLAGLSVGDAFGELFFGEMDDMLHHIYERRVPEGNWQFTDDTIMSAVLARHLITHGTILQDELALQWAAAYRRDPYRGYGGTAHGILTRIGDGVPWQEVSSSVFDGMGSMGNGAAMRSAVIGAWFADDPALVTLQASSAAVVTHYHKDAVDGAIAVAQAAALAVRLQETRQEPEPGHFLREIAASLPDGAVKARLLKSMQLGRQADSRTLASVLGNGSGLLAVDTVPFAVWCAAHYFSDYEEAIWRAVSVLGDRDTICAIAGSIVVLNTGAESIPALWRGHVEPLESWL